MVSEVQEFTVTGNERERRFIEVIVKNARENKPRVKKEKKEEREREKKRKRIEREGDKSNGREEEQDIVVRLLEIYKQYFSKQTGRIFIFIGDNKHGRFDEVSGFVAKEMNFQMNETTIGKLFVHLTE